MLSRWVVLVAGLGLVGFGGVAACSSSDSGESPIDAGSDVEVAVDASDGGTGCLICGSDASTDASLGAQVAGRFDSCRGIESGCHGSNAAGLSFPQNNEFVNIIRVPSTERPSLFRVDPGDPSESYLYLKLLGDGGIDGAQMPLGGPFDPALPELIFDWIEAGAPDP